jgi:hypothetical protein
MYDCNGGRQGDATNAQIGESMNDLNYDGNSTHHVTSRAGLMKFQAT